MYDIAIIGAGPAGATLARLVGDRYKVLLIDKRRIGSEAGKCCGGLLAPDAQGMLSTMGLGLPREVLVDPQLFVVRAVDVAKRIERYYQRYYINMDRGKFESWLLSMVPQSVDVRLGWRFKRYEPEGEGFRISISNGEGVTSEQARILVGADGARSALRKQAFGERSWPNAYIAIQEWVESKRQFPYFSSLFDTEICDYYCWTIPKGGALVIGAALTPRLDTTGKFELLRRKLREYGIEFGETIRREAAFMSRPSGPGADCHGQEGDWADRGSSRLY